MSSVETIVYVYAAMTYIYMDTSACFYMYPTTYNTCFTLVSVLFLAPELQHNATLTYKSAGKCYMFSEPV